MERWLVAGEALANANAMGSTVCYAEDTVASDSASNDPYVGFCQREFERQFLHADMIATIQCRNAIEQVRFQHPRNMAPRAFLRIIGEVAVRWNERSRDSVVPSMSVIKCLSQLIKALRFDQRNNKDIVMLSILDYPGLRNPNLLKNLALNIWRALSFLFS